MENNTNVKDIIDILYEQALKDKEITDRLSQLNPKQLEELNNELKKEEITKE